MAVKSSDHQIAADPGVWLPLARPSVPALIMEEFRRRLVEGVYVVGDRLPTIDDFAREFGVGRSSVREAIRALQMLGVLEVRQGDGVYVAPAESRMAVAPMMWGLLLTGDTRRNLIEVRKVLETEAAGLAASRATHAAVVVMAEAIADMRLAETPEAAAAADLNFHLGVSRAAGNPVLAHILEGLRVLLHQAFVEALGAEGIAAQAAGYHERILDAIRDRDEEGARRAMLEHLRFAAERWAKLYEQEDGAQSSP